MSSYHAVMSVSAYSSSEAVGIKSSFSLRKVSVTLDKRFRRSFTEFEPKMKLAVAILLVCVAIPHTFGLFDIPSFENIKNAGKRMQETVQMKAEALKEAINQRRESLQEIIPTPTLPTVPSLEESREKLEEMWKEIKENGSWEKGKKQLKNMWKEMSNKAGEHSEEFMKMWRDKKGTWRKNAEMAEKKLEKMKELYPEYLEKAKEKIVRLEEKLREQMPDRPREELKNINGMVKGLLKDVKEIIKMKINKIKEKFEERSGEPELFEGTEEPSTTEFPQIDPEEPETTTLPTEVPTEYLEFSGSEEVAGDEKEPEQPKIPGDDKEEAEEAEEEQFPEKEDEEEQFPEKEDEEEPSDEDAEDDNDNEDEAEEEDGDEEEPEVGQVSRESLRSTRKFPNVKSILKRLADKRKRLQGKAREFLGRRWNKQGRQNPQSREP